MEFFNKCFALLKDVVVNKNNLSFVLKEKTHFRTPFEKNNAVMLCGSFLRSYHLISTFVKNVFKSNDVDDVIAVGILYTGLAIKQYFAKEFTETTLNKYFKDKGIEITSTQQEEFNNLCKQQRKYEIPNVPIGSFKYFSACYNFPLWLIKMLHIQYGRAYLIPFMKASSKMPPQYAFKNAFEENKNFKKEIENKFKETLPNLYRFLPQTSIKKEPLVKEYYLLPIQEASYSILKYLPPLEDKDITLFVGCRTYDFFLPLHKYGENNSILFLEKNKKDNSEAMAKVVKYSQLKNLSRYQIEEQKVITYIDKPQDLIAYYPKSSAIDLIRREPEYAAIFDNKTLDDLIKNQEEGLKELSKHLKPEGYLIYAVNTVNIKETIVQINKFLQSNKSFKLEKEETFFPQDRLNSIYYFAILRKTK